MHTQMTKNMHTLAVHRAIKYVGINNNIIISYVYARTAYTVLLSAPFFFCVVRAPPLAVNADGACVSDNEQPDVCD